jgi:phage major head subunit gpT-like protein
MIINQAAMTAMYKSFRTIFNEAFTGVEPLFERVAMVVPSSGKEETYAWLGSFPKMREWLGDRHITNLRLHDYTVKNKKWESTIEVDRDDIEDDRIGVYSPMISEMARVAGVHPDELVFQLLSAGFATACFDGKPFFATDHPVGGSPVSNYDAGAGTAWFLLDTTKAVKPIIFQSRREVEFIAMDDPQGSDSVFMKDKFLYGTSRRDNAGYGLWQLAYGSTQPLVDTSYEPARQAMMEFKDEEGRPLGITPNLLVVPPGLEGAGRLLLQKEKDSGGADNPWYRTAELLVVPWL